jgi:hypothetical protein
VGSKTYSLRNEIRSRAKRSCPDASEDALHHDRNLDNIFVSYRRSLTVGQWVQNHLVPRLEARLNEVAPNPVRVFCDFKIAEGVRTRDLKQRLCRRLRNEGKREPSYQGVRTNCLPRNHFPTSRILLKPASGLKLDSYAPSYFNTPTTGY